MGLIIDKAEKDPETDKNFCVAMNMILRSCDVLRDSREVNE